MLAWYFAKGDNRLNYGDNRLIQIGKMHTVADEPELCKRGLHGSVRLIDALQYAPGPMLYRVDITRKLDIGNDKIVGQRRKYLAGFDATPVLREFAKKQALINIEKIKPYCSEADYTLIINWLTTGDEKIKAAAGSAAKSASKSASESADGSAAWSAARSVAETASRPVAESAWSAWSAWYAAKYTAWYTDKSAANDMLTQMVEAALSNTR